MTNDSLKDLSYAFDTFAKEVSAISFTHGQSSGLQILDRTYFSLKSYLSTRTSAIGVLLQSSLVWDAEILLRSVNECSIKAAYIFLDQSNEEAKKHASSFYDEYYRLSLFREQERTFEAAKLAAASGDTQGSIFLKRDADRYKTFAIKMSSKRKRQIEYGWGYSAMLKSIIKRGSKYFQADSMGFLPRGYGYKSHLSHSNPVGLGFIESAAKDPSDMAKVKNVGQMARIYGELTAAWMIFYLISRQNSEINPEICQKIETLFKLAKSKQAAIQRASIDFQLNAATS